MVSDQKRPVRSLVADTGSLRRRPNKIGVADADIDAPHGAQLAARDDPRQRKRRRDVIDDLVHGRVFELIQVTSIARSIASASSSVPGMTIDSVMIMSLSFDASRRRAV